MNNNIKDDLHSKHKEEKEKINLYKRIFVMGGPLSGKSTVCKLLAEEYNLNHLSIGVLMRNMIANPNTDIKLVKFLQDTINDGKLLSREMKNKLFGHYYNNVLQTTLFDGWPRITFDIEDTHPYDEKDCFILILTSLEQCIERLSKRLYCSKCSKNYRIDDKSIYNQDLNKYLCLKCDIELSKRTDDNLDTFKKRFEFFSIQQKLVLNELDKLGIYVHKIKSSTIQNTLANIKSFFFN